jgi:hypothetical protein
VKQSKVKIFNIVVKGHGLNLGLEAKSKKEATELIILQYQDLYQVHINKSDIIDIYQVKPSKYKTKEAKQ